MSTMHDDELPIIDDELLPPLWDAYLVNTTSRYAYWEARIDAREDGKFWLTTRWGRLPDALKGGNHKEQPYVNAQQAVAAAKAQVQAKLRGDYREAQRPGPYL